MVAEAQRHESEDKAAREAAEVKNSADSFAYGVERTVREHGDTFDPEDKTRIEEKIATLRKAIAEGEIEAIKSAQADLEQEQHLIAQKLYESKAQETQAEPETAGVGAETGGSAGEDVIDAEFKETKE